MIGIIVLVEKSTDICREKQVNVLLMLLADEKVRVCFNLESVLIKYEGNIWGFYTVFFAKQVNTQG